MTDKTSFTGAISSAAERVMESLPPDGGITSWELKTRLHLPSSTLYLALGWLCARGKVTLSPDELTYVVKAAAPHAEPQNETQPVS